LLSLSKSQIERLGVRLLGGPNDADLDMLRELLGTYRVVLDETVQTVSDELGLEPTARIKNSGTILEKLQRQGGSWLKSMYDVAGMRIVGSFDRNGQDELVGQLVAVFSRDGLATPRVIDRRATPSHGYRAVHVIVFPHGVPVEIQVRTRLQHEWAEVFEKLADKVGRGIRYGEPPKGIPPSVLAITAAPELHHPAEEDQLEAAVTLVRLVTLFGDAIAAYESIDDTGPLHQEVGASLEDMLGLVRALLDGL
jgi:ppGpp synthetase/RelA/SpoT-type nucleotidyltranferase